MHSKLRGFSKGSQIVANGLSQKIKYNVVNTTNIFWRSYEKAAGLFFEI